MMEPAVDPDLQPYGAWYTQPGGFLYHAPPDIGPAIEDARKRLTRVRQSPGDEPPLRNYRNAMFSFAAGAIQLLGALLMLFTGTLVSDLAGSGGGRRSARFDVAPMIMGASAVLLFGLGFRRLLIPPTRKPEAMFRTFLSYAIGSGRAWAARQMLKVDRAGERDRVVPRCMGPAEGSSKPRRFSSEFDFGQYWVHAFGGPWKLFRIPRFREMRSVSLASDVALVEARLVIKARRVWLLFVAQAPLMLSGLGVVAAIGIMAATRTFPQDKVTALLLVGLPFGIGLLATLVMTVLAFVPKEKKQFTIRKILVRVNGQWRIFNGELQGAEEGDVSWLRDM